MWLWWCYPIGATGYCSSLPSRISYVQTRIARCAAVGKEFDLQKVFGGSQNQKHLLQELELAWARVGPALIAARYAFDKPSHSSASLRSRKTRTVCPRLSACNSYFRRRPKTASLDATNAR